MKKIEDEKIIQSWKQNASLWTNVVRSNGLESRNLVTNEAIIDAVMSCEGSQILDVGCGEGWLSHALSEKGKEVTGFDVIPELVKQANTASDSKFHVISYKHFVTNPKAVGTEFDVVVCNFSLLGEDLDSFLKALLSITKPQGQLVIQTLHPYSTAGEFPYEDGWREETFKSLPGEWSPMPWYFRTMSSWIRVMTSSGWNIKGLIEPIHPKTGKPASLILRGIKSMNL